ncbi:AMP-binding protein, partial [Pseudomonas sp. 30_B]|uniref:AMP-binding protein n=1 Tax=Pseudomonas sp. 30_B TaxID=2813575 RepID=UPI001A9EE953
IQVCAERVDAADDPVPVGRPIDNVRLYVVDSRNRLSPVGVRGEILIGGAAPARGYLDRPALTAARFVADPIDPRAPRVYRSGDVGAWRADGRLDFFGRADDQVARHERRALQRIEHGAEHASDDFERVEARVRDEERDRQDDEEDQPRERGRTLFEQGRRTVFHGR